MGRERWHAGTLSRATAAKKQARRRPTRLLASSLLEIEPDYRRRPRMALISLRARACRSISAQTCGASCTNALTTPAGADAVALLLGGLLAPPHVYSPSPSTPSSFAGTGNSCGVSGSSL